MSKIVHCLLIFVNRCLIKDFERRPSVTHLLRHPFIKGVHGNALFLQKQLAEVLQDQKRLNPAVKTRYGAQHHPAASLIIYKNGMSCILICPAFITGNYHISAFLRFHLHNVTCFLLCGCDQESFRNKLWVSPLWLISCNRG